MKRKLNPKAEQHIKGAQLSLVEQALVGFVEEVLGRVASDEEILANGHHINVEGNDLVAFKKDGKKLCQFYVYDEHVLALGFVHPTKPLELSICRIREDEWPLPVRMHVKNVRDKKEGA